MKISYKFPFDGIVLEKGMNGREFISIHAWACLNSVKLRYANDCPENWLPVGSVHFVQRSLGEKIIPDYYPAWSKPILKRKVWYADSPPVKKCFIKPGEYKLFNGYVKGTGNSKGGAGNLHGYWCSDVVAFNNEWRLYLCNGVILDKGWYSGDNEDKPCPEVDINLNGVYGALDIGETESGIQIVEFHHPFACGWYGTDAEAYVKFLSEGYLKIRENIHA